MIKTIILYVKKVLIENQKHLKKRQKNDYLKNKNVRKNEYISIIIAPKIISQKWINGKTGSSTKKFLFLKIMSIAFHMNSIKNILSIPLIYLFCRWNLISHPRPSSTFYRRVVWPPMTFIPLHLVAGGKTAQPGHSLSFN